MSVSEYTPPVRCVGCGEVLDEESPDTITDSEGLQFHNTTCQSAFYLECDDEAAGSLEFFSDG